MSEAAVAATTTAPNAAPPPAVVEAPADTGADDGGDEISTARAKAREILFAKEEPTEAPKLETKPEPKPEPEKPKEPDETEVSRRYAKVHAQEQRLKARQQAFLQEQEAFKARAAEVEQYQSLAKSDPVKLLERAGWTKDQVIDWIRSDGKIEPEKLIKDLDERYKSEIQKMREEREAEKAAFEAEKRQREVKQVEQMLTDEVSSLLSAGKYPILSSIVTGDAEERASLDHRVREITMQIWNSKREAVEPHEVLSYLEGRWAKTVARLPGQAPAVKSASPVAVEPKPITNGATSERTVRSVEYDEMDPEQRKARADAILRGEIEPD